MNLNDWLAELERLDEEAPHAPWSMQAYESGTVVVSILESEFGKGGIRAYVNLIDGATFIERSDVELQQERFLAGQAIRDSRNALPVLVAMVRECLVCADLAGVKKTHLEEELQRILDESEANDE